ncbi:MAG: hypothetical protein ACT4PZ_16000 [Panacagrimonas sp.]
MNQKPKTLSFDFTPNMVFRFTTVDEPQVYRVRFGEEGSVRFVAAVGTVAEVCCGDKPPRIFVDGPARLFAERDPAAE